MSTFFGKYGPTMGGGGGGGGTVSEVDTGVGLTGGPITTTGTIELEVPVVIANGGTNSTAALANNRVMKSAGGAIVEAAAITAARALISDANGIPTQSVTTATELGYVSGVTSSIQTQLDAKEPTLTPGDISTSTTGVTIGSGTAATVGPNVTVDIDTADATHDGLLSAADWQTFDDKQAALTPGSISTSTTGVTVGSGANSTVGPNVTVNVQTANGSQQGLLSAADWTTFNGKQAAGNYITEIDGDVIATGPGVATAIVAAIAGEAVVGTTGSTNVVFSNGPTLTAPNLGTPATGTLTNCTGFPAANLAGLGTGVATWLATPSSANLAAAVTGETGSGALVFATSPTLVTPTLGVASATSINFGQSDLNFYQTASASITFSFNGSGGTSAGVTVVYTRIGDIVTLFIPPISATSGTSSTTFTSNSNLPSWAKPATTSVAITGPAKARNNGGTVTDVVQIQISGSSGAMIILRDNASQAWTNASSCGLATPLNVTYYVGTGS